MADEGNTRRLAAILAADVVDYSRLMHEDEDGTVTAWQAARRNAVDPTLEANNGRVVKRTGDGFLAEFATVQDAVRCAIAMQAALADSALDFRMGINLGDIIDDGDDIHGDGVNIAARLEGLADPGGICISGSVHDQVHNKLELAFTDMGEQKVKNIARPVRVFKVNMGEVKAASAAVTPPKPAVKLRMALAASIAIIIAVAAGLFVWQPWVTRVETASIDKMALPLPQKPSIAVLPFDNLSGDPKQDFFSDGITEDIITALSKIPAMFVIARNSTFTYKGKPVKVQKVAEELGVRFVLEGSVQRAGDQVRITAQLIDALSGRHLWAEKFDRDFKDIFALQDDITQKVVTALEVKLTSGDMARVLRRQTENLEAYEYYLRGKEHVRHINNADVAEATELYKKAIALDPNFSAAWNNLAAIYQIDARFGWNRTRARSVSLGIDAARKSLAIDDALPGAYMALANIAIVKRQYGQATVHCEKALSLNPPAVILAHCGRIWTYVGRSEEALKLIRKAMRRNPYFAPIYFFILGNAHRLLGNYDKAIAALEAQRKADPKSLSSLLSLANVYAEAGRMDEARAIMKESLKRFPKYSIKMLRRFLRYKDPKNIERYINNLRKAGLPE